MNTPRQDKVSSGARTVTTPSCSGLATISVVNRRAVPHLSVATRAAAIAVLVGFAFTQGALLNSDMAHEFGLAVQLLHGNAGDAWHHSHFPLLPSLFLLPAALGGELIGSYVGNVLASMEFVLLGGVMVWMGVRWGSALVPANSSMHRARITWAAALATPLWVYVVKVPMDVTLAAACCLLVVVAIERNRFVVAGIGFGLVLLSRDQLIPVAVVGAMYVALRYARAQMWRRSLMIVVPVGLAGLLLAVVNAARFGSPTNFGPGYQSSFGFNGKVLLELLFSLRSGVIVFMPVAVIGAWFLWRELAPSRRAPASIMVAAVMSLTMFLSAFLIHPNANPDLLQQWIGWSGGCRFLIPALPLVLCALPPVRHRVTRAAALVCGAVGAVASGSMLFVAYDAQQKISPIAGNQPPSPLRQWALVPTVARHTWDLLVHGIVAFHSSADYLPMWQVEAVRVHGRVTLLFTLPVTVAALWGAWRLSRIFRSAPTIPVTSTTTQVVEV